MRLQTVINAQEGSVLNKLEDNFTYPLDLQGKGLISNILEDNDIDPITLSKILHDSNSKLGLVDAFYNPAIDYVATHGSVTYKTNEGGEYDPNGMGTVCSTRDHISGGFIPINWF